jgi:hypothetical protein
MTGLAIRPFEDGELRVVDLELAEQLGFERPRDIRKLIERNLPELERYGKCATASHKPDRGFDATEYWLNEPQAVLICVLSKTLRAADVRQEVIEVFMAYRHGRIVPGVPTLDQIGLLFDVKLEPVIERVDRIEGNVTFLAVRMDDMAPRHDFSKEIRRQWRAVVHSHHYQDFCPCCGRVKILDGGGEKIPDGLHYDHFRGRERTCIDEGWPVCPACNFQLKNDAAFKERKRAHFAVFHDHRQDMFAGHRPPGGRGPRGGGGMVHDRRQGSFKV